MQRKIERLSNFIWIKRFMGVVILYMCSSTLARCMTVLWNFVYKSSFRYFFLFLSELVSLIDMYIYIE